jgi:hypothetical protein
MHADNGVAETRGSLPTPCTSSLLGNILSGDNDVADDAEAAG